MAAPILWAPGKNTFFLQEKPENEEFTHAHKIPRFRGAYFGFFWGGGSADFIFMGTRIFLTNWFSTLQKNGLNFNRAFWGGFLGWISCQ